MAAPRIGRRPALTPPPYARPDRNHPLAAGLLCCHVPYGRAGAVDLCGGPSLAVQNSPTWQSGRWGRGTYDSSGQNGYMLVTGSSGKYAPQPPLTVMWAGDWISDPTTNCMFYGLAATNDDSSPYLAFAISKGSGGTGGPNLYSNNAGSFISVDSFWPNPGSRVLVGVNNGSTIRCWTDGAPGSTAAAGSTINYTSTANLAMGWYGASGRPTSSVHNIGAMWTRELSLADVRLLSADPYCFLRW